MSLTTVLVVEDDGIIGMHLQSILNSWGYRVVVSMSGEDAFEQTLKLAPDLVLMDIHLQGQMDGIQAAVAIRANRSVPVVFLTAYADQDLTERARQAEPYGYLLKPVQERELRTTLEMAFTRFRADQNVLENERRFRAVFEQAGVGVTLTDSRSGRFLKVNQKFSTMISYSCSELENGMTFQEVTHPTDLAADLEKMERLRSGEIKEFTFEKRFLRRDRSVFWAQLTVSALWERGESPDQHIAFALDITSRKQAEEAQERSYDETIEGWSRAMDLRDSVTEEHTRRVKDMTLALARLAGIPESERVHMRRGALLHDIGKMGVPDVVLLKPDRLTEEEWEIMRRHPRLAYDLLSPIEYLRPALDIPYCHHERWDGSGYPRGLKGKEIPLAARLFAVADVWDAITNDRPYSKAWLQDDARAYIVSQAGTHFDPDVIALFENLLDGA